jgi:hypothetical protein
MGRLILLKNCKLMLSTIFKTLDYIYLNEIKILMEYFLRDFQNNLNCVSII